MPPAVSIENDFPGIKFLALPAEISFIKVNPEIRQNGRRTRSVKTIPAKERRCLSWFQEEP